MTTPALARSPVMRVPLARKRLDTVGGVGAGGEGGEAGGAGGGARDRPEPGGEPFEVDRGRGGDVLEVRSGQPAIAAATQPEGAHPLREGALDPGPPAVAVPALLGAQPFARRLERLVLGPRLQLQVPGLVLAARARGPRRAGAAVGPAEPHRDVGCAGLVGLGAPG